jgi:hypothetical protein
MNDEEYQYSLHFNCYHIRKFKMGIDFFERNTCSGSVIFLFRYDNVINLFQHTAVSVSADDKGRFECGFSR